MYTPRGLGVSELGDIEVVPDGKDLHLFHLTLPNHDVVQHAISRDGLSWSPLPAALRTGDPGAVDDDQIWTMSVTRRLDGDGFVMLYTALSSVDGGRVQRIAAATSADLIRWTKVADNPVAVADARWYEADPSPVGAVSWRDPKPTRVGDRFVATVAARENASPLPRRGCVGLITSDDLEGWTVQPPLFAPRRYWDLECPQLVRIAGDWYLIASVMEDRSLRYWRAADPAGPFRAPPGGDLLAPAGHYATRVAPWRGMDLLFAWHQPALHRGWMTTPNTIDWLEARNPFGKFLAPPLRLSRRDDGSLALGSFPGWEEYRSGDWRPARPARSTQFAGRVVDAWRIASPGGMDLLLADALAIDVVVEGSLTLSAARGGLAVRTDETGSGLYVELEPGSRAVRLQRWGTRHRDRGESLGLLYDVVQEGRRREPTFAGRPVSFRVVSVGPYLEVTLDGEVAIATATGQPRAEGWGFWVEDGEGALADVRWAPVTRPQPGRAASAWREREHASVE